MIAVVQRVSHASVAINGKTHAQINQGFLVLLGICQTDSTQDAAYIAKKIVGLRVFGDDNGKMNLDLKSIDGNVLVISQFTLYAQTKKGNRPSFIDAARPEVAIPLYKETIEYLEKELGKDVETGVFGADMQVSLLNDGPVTIILNSRD
jgi:D-aminoacyl-tRNA deacylase